MSAAKITATVLAAATLAGTAACQSPAGRAACPTSSAPSVAGSATQTGGDRSTGPGRVRPIPGWPAVVSSGYRTQDRPDHWGIDLAAPEGVPVSAYADGVVSQAGPASGFGTWVVVDHHIDGAVVSTVYGAMRPESVRVHPGDTVTAGQQLAEVGSDGVSTGPHLHFEVWPGGRMTGGTDTDPGPWLDKAVDPGASAAVECGRG